jgi:hypothetical protein
MKKRARPRSGTALFVTSRNPPAVRDPPATSPLLAFRVPAAAGLGDFPFLLEPGQDAVQVVLLDAHLRGELRNRDAGLTTAPQRHACRCLCAVQRDRGRLFWRRLSLSPARQPWRPSLCG